MPLIPRIVSTPARWVSKRLLDRFLLRFPGGEHDLAACVYCPEMCRFACPAAVASGNDVVTPSAKMGLLHKERLWPGRMTGGAELWSLYDCTGCGRCTEYCVYGMPVARELLGARAAHPWKRAREVAAKLTDSEDPWGDLAAELGDAESASRRLRAALSGARSLVEPKSLWFARESGERVSLAWEATLLSGPSEEQLGRLRGTRWLLHESPWLSRHADRAKAVAAFVERAIRAGVEIRIPFESGRDCRDCGWEGAYPRLFPRQAEIMARDLLDRDPADGVLCFSERCASGFRALGARAEWVGKLPGSG